MKAVILCPGPSLEPWSLRERMGDHQLRIGVNRAAKYPCDVWACGDAAAAVGIGPEISGHPALLTAMGTLESFPWPCVLPIEGLFGFLHPAQSQTAWSLFSFTSALVYAAFRGADLIDVFGCDWQGTADFDGREAGEQGGRTQQRWRDEQIIFDKTCRALPAVKIQRIGKGPDNGKY